MSQIHKVDFFGNFAIDLNNDFNNFIMNNKISPFFEQINSNSYKYLKKHYPLGRTVNSDPYAFNQVVRIYFNGITYIHSEERLFAQINGVDFTFLSY